MMTKTTTATISYFSDADMTSEQHTIKVTVDKECYDGSKTTGTIIRDLALHHMQLIADIKCWNICDVHYIASIN